MGQARVGSQHAIEYARAPSTDHYEDLYLELACIHKITLNNNTYDACSLDGVSCAMLWRGEFFMKPPRLFLPVSRILLVLLVGSVFIFRATAASISLNQGKPVFSVPVIITFFAIGILLVLFAAYAIFIRWKHRG